MEVQELRLGNLVTTVEGTKHFGKELEIEFLTNNNCYDLDAPLDSINGYELNKVIPIPLTEEWISKLGFGYFSNKQGQLYYKHRENGWTLLHSYGKWHYSTSMSLTLGRELKYVHELQNLYFALIGEELTLINKK